MKKQKTVYQYLLTIPGFGEYRAKQILASLGIAITTKMKISNLAKSEIKNRLAVGIGAVKRKVITLPSFKENLLLQALASLRKGST
jgi:ribosomal protein S13